MSFDKNTDGIDSMFAEEFQSRRLFSKNIREKNDFKENYFQKAEELINKFVEHTKVYHEVLGWEDYIDSAKKCALIAVDNIILANPHSNPFNTDFIKI